jgi:hypothetical protein
VRIVELLARWRGAKRNGRSKAERELINNGAQQQSGKRRTKRDLCKGCE